MAIDLSLYRAMAREPAQPTQPAKFQQPIVDRFQHKEYEGTAAKIAKLLGLGFPAERVANAVGCEPSYVSQLLSQDDFRDKVQEHKLLNLTAATERDQRADRVEEKLLVMVEQDIDRTQGHCFKSTADKVRILTQINGLKRRGANADGAVTQVNNTVVQLVMPTWIKKQYEVVTDINNQIIEVDKTCLVSMQSGTIEGFSNNFLELGERDEHSSNGNRASEQDSNKGSRRKLGYPVTDFE